MSPTLKPQFSLSCQPFGKFPMLRKALRKLSRKQMGYFLLAVLVAMSLWLGQAQVSHASRVGDRIRDRNQTTEAVQPSRLSSEQEMRVGQKMDQDLLRSGEFTLYRNPDIQNYVVGIGGRYYPTAIGRTS